MEKKLSCGFGASLESFYSGVNNTNLSPAMDKSCGTFRELSRFGKKQLSDVVKSFEKKGTKGSFRRWCKMNGYNSADFLCINKAKKSNNLKIRRKAIFAQNIRPKNKKIKYKKYKKKKTLKENDIHLKAVNNDIKYLLI